MVAFGVERLRDLVQYHAGPCISIYVPLGAGPETEESRIQVKNLLRRAEDALQQWGFRRPEAEKLLKPARPLLESARESHPRGAAMAVLLAPGEVYDFQLPYPCDPLSVVGERFHITPLIPSLHQRGRFYVLGLAQKAVQLYQGDRHDLRAVEVPDLPPNIDQAVLPNEIQRAVQFHTRTAPQPGRRGAIFFGQSAAGMEEEARLQHFCRRVDDAVAAFLSETREPLILAAVDSLQPIYRALSRYARLLPQGIVGSPELVAAHDLHAQAWAIAAAAFRAAELKHLKLVPEAISKKRGSTVLPDILSAAVDARVAELSIASDRQQWGRFDPQTRKMHLDSKQSAQNEELLNFAAVHAFKHGAAVHVVPSAELPNASPAAAIFRF